MVTATPSRSRIFISYRHEDTDVAAGRLADDLRKHFSREQVFQDFASIEPGTDFTVAVQHGLESCAAVLVIIGPKWLTITDRQGRRRLDLPDDWVTHEIAESLKRPEVRVFPILVDADMPSAEELPEPLQPLTRRQAFPLTSRHWPNDVADLIAFLKKVPGLAGTATPAAETSEAGPAVRTVEPAPQTAQPRRPPPETHPPPRGPEQEASAQAVSAPTTTETHGQPENPTSHPLTAPEPDVGGVGQAPWVRWKALAGVSLALGIVVLLFYTLRPQPPVEDPRTTRDQNHAPAQPATTEPTPKIGERPVERPGTTPDLKAAPGQRAPTVPSSKVGEPPMGGRSTTPDQKPAPARPAPRAPTPKVGESFRDCERCPEMVVIPAGTFLMGSPAAEGSRFRNEGPQHWVTLARTFAVGKYEVTFEERDACIADGGCTHKPGDEGWGRSRQPVINVSWEEAQAYVSWLAKKTGRPYRLLSEAEWEYTARGGTTTRYPWGDEPGRNRANFAGSGSKWSGKETAPVGSFAPNRFGLHDMIGNVWEWVQDCNHDTYDGAPSDGSAWESGDCCAAARSVAAGGGSYARRTVTGTGQSAGTRVSGFGWRCPHSSLITDRL